MKTIFITGSSRGIGKAIAKKFLSQHWNVIINADKSEEELAGTVEELKQIRPNVLAMLGDVSQYEEAKQIFTRIEEQLGSIDVLVNNAGLSYVGLFNTMEPGLWRRLMDVNVLSMMNCTHLALKDMVRRHSGNVVNISSIWGTLGASCEVVYSASKGAVNSFTKALAKELGPSGVRVNAISCGAIETKMNEWLTDEEKDSFLEEIPLARFGRPEEVAELVYYIVSDNASYITGQIIGLDGGF